MEQIYYRIGQAAEILGATPHHLRTLCQRGLIAGVQTTRSGHYRIPQSAIDKMEQDGVPPIPAGIDHPIPSAVTHSSSPRSPGRSDLFAEPSERVIDAQEDLVIAERLVKKRSLDLQLEEIEDRFRERDVQAEQTALELRDADERRRLADEHRRCVDKWTENGLELLPWGFPLEKRALVIEKLRAKLTTFDSWQSKALTEQLVDSIVAEFTRPWERANEIQRMVEGGIPFELRNDGEFKQAALEEAWQVVRRLGSDPSDRMIKGAVEQVCKPLLLRREHKNHCNLLLEGLWSQLRGGTLREMEDAKDSVRDVLSAAAVGTPLRKLEQLRDEALVPFKKAIASRQDREMRERLLDDTFALSLRIAGKEVQKAVQEAQDAFRQLPAGTAENKLRDVRDKIFERYREKQFRMDEAVGDPLRRYIQELSEEWEFDKSTWVMHSELSETVRRELTEDLDGTETQEDVNELMQQIVQEALDIE